MSIYLFQSDSDHTYDVSTDIDTMCDEIENKFINLDGDPDVAKNLADGIQEDLEEAEDENEFDASDETDAITMDDNEQLSTTFSIIELGHNGRKLVTLIDTDHGFEFAQGDTVEELAINLRRRISNSPITTLFDSHKIDQLIELAKAQYDRIPPTGYLSEDESPLFKRPITLTAMVPSRIN